jgi:Sec7-like guanine-nucleotide exchange factor
MRIQSVVSSSFKVHYSLLIPEYKFLPKEADAPSIADFLTKNNFISKKSLGEYLAKSTNQDVLNAFVQKLGFKGVYLLS